MATLILQRNFCLLEILANFFHRRNTIGKHQIFRLEFSGGFQLLQFHHQFRMQRAGLLLTILDEGSGQHPIRIGRIQMKIAAMQGVDFTPPQTRMHGQQIKQFARCCQQSLGFIIIQSPPLAALLAARIHFADDFKRIGRNTVLFAEPGEQGRQDGVILIDGFGRLCLFGAPAQERIRCGIAQALPVAFPHQPPQTLVHMADMIYGTS